MDETNDKTMLDRVGISVSRTTSDAKSRNATSGHFFMSINCHSLFLLVLFVTTLNLAHSAPVSQTITVLSITSPNPLHMVIGDSPYVTTGISQGKFE